MSTEYKTISLDDFIQRQKKHPSFYVKSTVKNLSRGVTMTWYMGPSSTYFAAINQTVYCFDNYEDGDNFWKATNKPPFGTVRYKYEAEKKHLEGPLDLDYNILTYEYFNSCKRGRGWISLLSENILADGRVSLLYSDSFWSPKPPRQYFLVIGQIVLCYHSFEPLKRLEFAINSGVLQYWRPEIAGTMDYIPKYSVSDYIESRHSKYTLPELLVREQELKGVASAKIYRPVNKTVRYYLRIENKLYSFGSAEDCELILSNLKDRDFSNVPLMDEKSDRLLSESVELTAARLTMYLNADMHYYKSELLTVSKNGSLTGLNAII
ncbi:MAG: hypothetical protein WKF70_09155 [Chitinophagaceae bacterium]